jgi:hypothetical protein
MTKLHSYKDSLAFPPGCFANIRMDNGDPCYISVAQTGVLVKKSRLGWFGAKLYDEKLVYRAAKTAQLLAGMYPEKLTPEDMTNPILDAFTNAVLHCSTLGEATVLMNQALEKREVANADQGAATQTVSMTEENRREAEERLRIVSDYGEFIERNPPVANIWDVKYLPHDKETILDAICLEIVRQTDEKLLNALEVSAVFLAYFQEGVGVKPLSQLGVDLTSADRASRSADDLKALAEQIAGNPDRERYEALLPLVHENEQEISARLAAAKQIRREMPEDKKRKILG